MIGQRPDIRNGVQVNQRIDRGGNPDLRRSILPHQRPQRAGVQRMSKIRPLAWLNTVLAIQLAIRRKATYLVNTGVPESTLWPPPQKRTGPWRRCHGPGCVGQPLPLKSSATTYSSALHTQPDPQSAHPRPASPDPATPPPTHRTLHPTPDRYDRSAGDPG